MSSEEITGSAMSRITQAIDYTIIGHFANTKPKRTNSLNSDNQVKHARRTVGHVSGWREQLDTCICGKPWPCPDADTSKNSQGSKEIERLSLENARLVMQVDKWTRFSERNGWLDPKDFDEWRNWSETKIKLLQGPLRLSPSAVAFQRMQLKSWLIHYERLKPWGPAIEEPRPLMGQGVRIPRRAILKNA